MRGADTFTESLFTMRRLDDLVSDNHPLRTVRKMVNLALKNIKPLLSGMYAADIKGGRPSIAPAEKLLRAMLLQIFYIIRSERLRFQIAKSVPEYSTQAGAGIGFADQYFSSLLKVHGGFAVPVP
jgi:hypothetical protein